MYLLNINIVFEKNIRLFVYANTFRGNVYWEISITSRYFFKNVRIFKKEVSCLLVLMTPCLFHFNKKWNKKENKHEGIQISAFLLELMNELLEVYGESLVSFEFTTINLNLSLKLNLKSSLRLSLNWIWV